MIDLTKDTFCLGGHEFQSRFILGSGKYSLELIKAAVENAGAQIITLALRRTNQDSSANILDYIPEGVTLLPNTSGSKTAEEAVRIARLSREICHSDFVKLEVIPDSKRRIYRYAVYVSGSQCRQRSGQCRRRMCYASRCPDWIQ